MGIADRIRIAMGRLTPEETAERDAAARARREQAERRTLELAAQHQAAGQQRAQFQRRISLSAGIASVQLTCHQDTWKFIQRWTRHNPGTYDRWDRRDEDSATQRDHGLVALRLSGPQLTDVIITMAWVGAIHGTRPYGAPYPQTTDEAIARRVYAAIGAIVDQVDPDAPKDHHVPPIVIDDRVVAPEEQHE